MHQSNENPSPAPRYPSPETVAIALEAAQHRRAMRRISEQLTEECRSAIADAAYRSAERRGFTPGHELEDWLAAEEQVYQRLIGEARYF
jgi:hypothetical protein